MEWRVVKYNNKEFPNYLVNEKGDVYSRKRDIILNPFISPDGYQRITMRKDGIRITANIHRIVKCSFDEYQENMTIDHVDGNKLNNHISNLDWCTASENSKRGHRLGLCTSKGWPIEIYDLEGNLIEEFTNTKEAMRAGYCEKSIIDQLKGRIKNPKKFIVKYKNNEKRNTK